MFDSLRKLLAGSQTSLVGVCKRRLELELLEDRTVPTIVVGSGMGGSTVELYDDRTQQLLRTFTPFPGFTQGINVAVSDFNADMVPDVVVSVAANGAPHVKVLDGRNGAELRSFFAYDTGYVGGVTIAVGDVNNDGVFDIITGTANSSSHVKVFDGRTNAVLRSFFAFEGFTGGVNVAGGNIDGIAGDEVIASVRKNGAPHVKVFNNANTVIRSFFAYTQGFQGGVNIDTGDFNADGIEDIITGTGTGGSPHVKVFNGTTLTELDSFFAYDQGLTSGVNVSRIDVDGDNRPEVLTVPQSGARAHVRAFGIGAVPKASFFTLGTTTAGASISAG